jgi:hypothetical protein
MSISFRCSGCGKDHKVRDEFAGKKVKCKCGQTVQLPTAANRQAANPVQSAPGASAEAPDTKSAEAHRFNAQNAASSTG